MKRLTAALFAALLCLTLSACSPADQSRPAGEQDVTFTDSLGNQVALEQAPKRVAALLGSYAEAWVLAGGEGSLAAVTRDAFEERGMELGEQVANLGESHQPNLEALFAAQPDLVLLTPDLEGQLALKESLDSAGIPNAWFKVETFEDYLLMLGTFTDLTGREDLYERNGLAVQARIEAVKEAAEQKEGPTILLLRAFSSNVKAKNSDNTAGVMLRDLGCKNIADSDSGLLEELQMEAILTADPEHIFVVTMGANTQKALDNLEALFQSDPAWQSLTAIKEGNVHVLDKQLFHYKPNARWGESYEKLAGILYPET
jgi:iron complex transport system substrate-binding protein